MQHATPKAATPINLRIDSSVILGVSRRISVESELRGSRAYRSKSPSWHGPREQNTTVASMRLLSKSQSARARASTVHFARYSPPIHGCRWVRDDRFRCNRATARIFLAPQEAAMTNSPKSALAGLLGLAVVLAATPGEAEDAVLVSSTVDRYVPGSVITDDQTLSLPSGTDAVLLFRSGAIVRLKGPFEGRLNQVRPAGAPGGTEGL